MATVLRSLRLTRCAARSLTYRPITPRYAARPFGKRREFSSTPIRMRREIEDYDEDDDDDGYDREDDDEALWDDGYEEEEKEPEDPEVLRIMEKADKHWESRERRKIEDKIDRLLRDDTNPMGEDMVVNDSLALGLDPDMDIVDQLETRSRRQKRRKAPDTFLNYGEEEIIEEEGDDELIDDGDEYAGMGTLAHFELEQHREWRHYARLAAWDMPLLSKLCKPFEPPAADMPLRFRYTTYLGEHHPAEKKVVLEFCPQDLPNLTDVQRNKLRKLCGPRYNPQTDIVKMSSEMYESQAQNKRYLGDRVDELMKEARDPTDTFEDVPLDTRHHKFKPKPKFPARWKLTQQRQERLNLLREDRAVKEELRMLSGSLVNGVHQIEKAFVAESVAAPQSIPEMAMARGMKPRILAMRR